MATSLMAQPCGDECNQEAEYQVSFVVTSLEMMDKDKGQMFSDVLMIVTWDGNVVKLMNDDEEAETFDQSMNLLIHATAANFSKKLKESPIMFDLTRKCNELGSTKLTISECFADAVLCDDFSSQTVTNEFKFIMNERKNAEMTAYFRVQKLLDDGVGGDIYSSLQSQRVKHAKAKVGKKKAAASASAAGGDDDDDYESDNEGEDGCKDFMCPDELPENCKNRLGLDEDVYRIINGNLINIKEKIGPCGEKCPVAQKLIKDLRKSTPADIPLSARFNFNDGSEKCAELFDCFSDCGQNQTKPFCSQGGSRPKPSSEPKKRIKKFDMIEQVIQEEDLLKNLCDKYELSVDDIRSVGEVDGKKCKKSKKSMAKKLKKKSKKIAASSKQNLVEEW